MVDELKKKSTYLEGVQRQSLSAGFTAEFNSKPLILRDCVITAIRNQPKELLECLRKVPSLNEDAVHILNDELEK